MSWLLPSALAIAGVAGVATIALHFIARSRPLAEPLPTARFIPQRPVRARTRSMALTDIALLLMRLGAILALGAAVASPVFAAARGRLGRVILVDRSSSVADVKAAVDSARTVARPGDVVIAFDSAAETVPVLDSIRRTTATGSLSAGLAAALRAAASLSRTTDSLELVIVSPLAGDEIDAATTHLRTEWPGRARLIRTGTAQTRQAAPVIETAGSVDDPVVAGLSLMAPLRAGGWIRLVRGVVSQRDSAWASDSGHVLVHWPASQRDAIWPARRAIDAIGAVASSSGTMVARFPRLWAIEGNAIARWSDGEPAAVERAVGAGCIRDIAILTDPASDVTLREPFRALAGAFLAPCGGARSTSPADTSVIAAMLGPNVIAKSDSFRDRDGETSRWTPWLLGLAAGLLIVELAARRTIRGAV